MAKKRRRRGLTKRDVAVAVGAAAAATVQACDNTGTICDPPPPPLCDLLNRDVTMVITADRDTVPAGESVTFSGTVVDTLVKRIEGLGQVYAQIGSASPLTFLPPRSFTFSWSPPAAPGSETGRFTLSPQFQVVAYGEGHDSTRCWIGEEIKVDVDAAGTAAIVSLPHPQDALGLHFGVTIEAEPADEGFNLAAGTNLPPDVAEQVVWRWRASGGRIEATGADARFVPDPGATMAVIQAQAHVGEGSLSVASWTWRR